MIAKNGFYRRYFSTIPYGGGGRMSVQMLNIDWLQPGTLERDFHRTGRASTVLWTGSHMVCISASAVSYQFGYGFGTPSEGMFQLLYDDQTSPFGHYETIALGVEWPRRQFRG